MSVFRLSVLTFAAATLSYGQTKNTVTYRNDVTPIIKQSCLPCHLEENENPSELFLDDYALLMKGGKNGKAVVAGKPEESNFYLKLLPDPPFGKQMPRKGRKLTEDEVKVIYDWIAQGARDTDAR